MQRTRKKRIICMLLAVAMMLSVFPPTALATDEEAAAVAAPTPVSETPPNTAPDAPTNLRTTLMEHDAWSIDPGTLNFSWVVNDPDMEEYQAAYQIQLATTRANLTSGTNLIYDTTWVTSDQSTAVRIPALTGLLTDNAMYFWRVRTQDKDGAESPWSELKVFTTQVDWADDRSVWLEPYVNIPVTAIRFTRDSMAVALGGTGGLSPIFEPVNASNRFVAWESANETIATVDDNGTVTGVALGTTQITVTAFGGHTATINVTVVDTPFIRVDALLSGILPLSTVDTVLVGAVNGMDNEPIDIAEATVTFVSSNPTVASVTADGVVTGLGAGITDITVTVEWNGMTDIVTISVMVVLPPVNNVILSETDRWDMKPGDNLSVTATVLPAGADQTLVWASAVPSVATVDQSGNIAVVGQGTTTITATAVGGMTARLEIVSIDPGHAATRPAWSDYIFEVEATYFLSTPASYVGAGDPMAFGAAGFSMIFRGTGSSATNNNNGNLDNAYFWQVRQPEDGANYSILRVHRNAVANSAIDIQLPEDVAAPGRRIAYTIVIIDDRVTTFIDGRAVDHNRVLAPWPAGPATALHPAGRVGFRTGNFEGFTVHSMNVTATNGVLLYEADLENGQNLNDWVGTPGIAAIGITEQHDGVFFRAFNRIVGLRPDFTQPTPVTGTVFQSPVPTAEAMVAELPGNDRFDHELRNFVFMRHEFEMESMANVERVIMSAAAHNTENSCQHIFDLYLNADHVGLGPARIGFAYILPHAFYNSFDVTEAMQEGANVIGVIAHDKGMGMWGDRTNQTGGPSRMFMLELRVYYTDGTTRLITSTAADHEDWLAMDGTRAFGDRGNVAGENINNAGWYNIRREHMNTNHFPFGWNELDFETDWQWRPVSHRTAGVGGYYRMINRRPGGLLPYHGGNMMRHRITDGPDGNGHGMDFTWVDDQGITTEGGAPGRVTHVVNEKRVIPFDVPGQPSRVVIDMAQNIVGGLEIHLGDLLEQLPPEDITLTIRLGEFKPWYRTQIGHFPGDHTGTALRGNNTNGWVRSNGWGHPPYVFDWVFRAGEYNPPIQNFNMMNFRWVEIAGLPAGMEQEILPQHVSGIAYRQPFDYEAHHFDSTDPWLNNLWEYARYAIKATTQCLWTDTKARERRAYEGDALVNMLMHNTFSSNYRLGRHTHEHMLFEQTWPMEYRLYSIEKAWWDYLFTGCTASIERFYNQIHNKFNDTDGGRSQWNNAHGLYVLNAGMQNDNQNLLIDWPWRERDNHQRTFGRVSTVHNAVAAGAHTAMANIADRLDHAADRDHHQGRADRIRESIVDNLLIEGDGYSRFTDAADHTNLSSRSNHTAQHSVAYPLAYGVFDSPEMAMDLAQWIDNSGGFRTSIFSASFVLRGLYNAGAGDIAMRFLTEPNPVDQRRSFHHVLTYLRATISPESWSYSLKWNSTMSHPWGATPATAVSMGVFGIEPLAGAFSEFQVRLQPGGLEAAEIKYPTIRGPVLVEFENGHLPNLIEATVTIPANTRAQVSLPVTHETLTHLIVDGVPVAATRVGNFLMVELGSGVRHIRVQMDQFLEVEAEISQSAIEVDRTAEIKLVSVVNELLEAVDMETATVVFATDPEGIVTVCEEGVVTPITVGATEILITVTDNRGISETVRIPITVTPISGPERIVAVEIRLDEEYLAPGVTAQATLVAIRRDGDAGAAPAFEHVTFVSSNPAVATVTSDGEVTVLTEGEFTIEARTTEHFTYLIPDFDFERFEIDPLFTWDGGANPFTGGTGSAVTVVGDRLRVPGGANRLLNTGLAWTDYMFTATMNVDLVAGGLNFRSTNATNMFMWQFRPGDNTLNPHIAPNGGFAALPPTPIAVGNFNPIRQDNQVAIAVEGNRIMTYVNGVLADTRTDNRHPAGTIGVRTGGSEVFYLSDIVVGPRVLLTTQEFTSAPPPAPHTISWVLVGGAWSGEFTPPATVADGGTIAAIAEADLPTRDGFTFAGWAPELPLEGVTGPVTVTAQWDRDGDEMTFAVETVTGAPGARVEVDILVE
ncbi:MAG: Ig-like domain-containing protein, partial [Oscillospiraceae bacterium]|nr:Ig-like domain-containing protein [Oscillospiraceae bacterium]